MDGMQAVLHGTRLEYVIVPIEGTVKRKEYRLVPKVKNKEGKVTSHERKEVIVDVPGGFMVYFPRGHALRMTEADLIRYNLKRPPKIINMQGLADPNSPLGKLMAAQDDGSRAEAYQSLQQKVIALATMKTGPNILLKEAA